YIPIHVLRHRVSWPNACPNFLPRAQWKISNVNVTKRELAFQNPDHLKFISGRLEDDDVTNTNPFFRRGLTDNHLSLAGERRPFGNFGINKRPLLHAEQGEVNLNTLVGAGIYQGVSKGSSILNVRL